MKEALQQVGKVLFLSAMFFFPLAIIALILGIACGINFRSETITE